MMGSLHYYCWNGGRFRLPMCLIRKQEEKEGHTYQGKAEVGKSKGEGKHEAVKTCTRRVQDTDVVK